MKKGKKKKGFSLVELLAVVVILGILSVVTIVSYNRYIKSSKEQYYKQMEKNAIMATKSYLQANKQYQPKNVGSVQKIYLVDLISNNYLKESDFSCENGKKCNYDDIDVNTAYVNVTKESNNKFDYYFVLSTDTSYALPYFSNFNFTGKINSDGNSYDASSVSFSVNIEAYDSSKTAEYDDDNIKYDNLVVASYSYVVYVCSKDNNGDCTEADYSEVYNSGFLSGGKQKKVVLKNVDLSRYIKLNKVNNVMVKFFATNNKGQNASSSYDIISMDSEGPICGTIEGEPIGNSWLKQDDLLQGKKRKISVQCIDNGGSKCKKKKYTKTWDKKSFDENDKEEHKIEYIKIYDNAGNYTNCPVTINIDTRDPDSVGPTLKISADNKSGKNGFTTKTIAGGSNYTIKTSDYSNTVGDLNWLNKSNYPSGIVYHVEVVDVDDFDRFEWELNNSNYKAYTSESVYKKLKAPETYNDKKMDFTFDGNGMRYAVLTAYDKSGNKTVVNINANLDHTNPNIPTAKIKYDSKKTQSSYLYDGPNSRDPQYKEKLWWGDFAGTDAISGTARYEYAVDCKNPTLTGYTNSSGYTKPNNGSTRQDSCYKLRQVDNAGNYSDWSGGYYLNIDLTTTPATTFTGRSYFGYWRWMSKERSSCDGWAATYKGNCPTGRDGDRQYGNVLGRVQKSAYDANTRTVRFFWEVINGSETFVHNGYYVYLMVYRQNDDGSTGSLVQQVTIKDSDTWWKVGTYNYGWVNVTLPSKGDYEVHFYGDTYDPDYVRYMGWFRIS